MNNRFWRPISVCWLEYYPWVVRFSGPLGAGLSSMSWRHYTWWYHLCLQMHFIMIIFRKWFGNRHAHTELDSKAVPRLQECCRQVEVEAVSIRRNKIHQTLEWSYSPALYMVSNSTFKSFSAQFYNCLIGYLKSKLSQWILTRQEQNKTNELYT